MIAKDLENLARPIDTLKSLPGNPRKGDVDAVARSYERFGQRKPIVATKDGTVIAGNHQLAAARKLGWSEIAVVVVDDDELTAKAFALADNRTADLGTYDNELLAELLADVAVDETLLGATGYNTTDLDELIASLETPEPLIGDPDEIPAKAPAKTVRGDVWLLGEHRLMCGDSTVPTDVERLMAGKKAKLLVTDPPYGVSYADKNKVLNKLDGGKRVETSIENDSMLPDQMSEFWVSAFTQIRAHMESGASYYVTGPQGGDLLLLLLLALKESGFPLRHMLIWAKNNHVLGRSDYHYKHEPIIYGWVEGSHTWHGDRSQTSLWEIDKPTRSELHPTTKPVELYERTMNNNLQRGELAVDVFAGSGTVFMAAQQTGRIAYGLEYDPHYCDIICARFQKATGIMPIAESTGNPHDFLGDQ